jgi:L-ascorbate metabolism protein UlaG (beta-lactamase superfamily)
MSINKRMMLMSVLLGSGLLIGACVPQMGATGRQERNTNSQNFRDGRYHNKKTVEMSMFSSDMWGAFKEQIFGKQVRVPLEQIPTVPIDTKAIGQTDETRITWLGHSTMLIEVGGQVILTDPVFSDRASPFSLAGPKRFKSALPITPDGFEHIDSVLISHDHYDHLDYQTILQLDKKVGRFYVPMGVGGHLKKWGVSSSKIIEMDWWQESEYNGLKFALTPARHFSGRGLRRNLTLWGSWVIMNGEERLFFSGDSGYFDGFKEIGEKYGPFDITMLESGAYNTAWADVHMMPEETVQAHIDLRGKTLLPIHWAKFNLSIHSWTEPIERLLAAAQKNNVQVVTPVQGDGFAISKAPKPNFWWKLQNVQLQSHLIGSK